MPWINWFDFLILALATWRITYMFVWEDGPGGIFVIFREKIIKKASFLESLFSCVWCLSVWVGAIIGISAIIKKTITLYVCLPFALSALAILITEFIDGES